jgi:hypothetical protein
LRDAVALLLSVERMIENGVLAYLQRLGRRGLHCYTVHRAERLDERRPEEWVWFFEAVKEELRKVQADGPTRRIYLFCGLPLPLGVLAGVTLANRPEVIVHYFTGGSDVPLVRVFEKTVTLCEPPSPVRVPGAAEAAQGGQFDHVQPPFAGFQFVPDRMTRSSLSPDNPTEPLLTQQTLSQSVFASPAGVGWLTRHRPDVPDSVSQHQEPGQRQGAQSRKVRVRTSSGPQGHSARSYPTTRQNPYWRSNLLPVLGLRRRLVSGYSPDTDPTHPTAPPAAGG